MARIVEMNEKTKEKMERACSDLGLSVNDVLEILAKKIETEKRIPFDMDIDPFYSESNIRYLEQKMDDYKAGKLKIIEHDLIED